MRIFGAAILLATNLVLATTGTSETMQGLLLSCTHNDMADEMYCLGFVSGVFDSAHFEMLMSHPKFDYERLRSCSGITQGAAKAGFVNWANQHPDKWNLEAFLRGSASLVHNVAVSSVKAANCTPAPPQLALMSPVKNEDVIVRSARRMASSLAD